MSKLMENEVYNAAVNGDLTIFGNKKPEELLNKTYQDFNIIHVAAKHKQIQFIKAAMNNFPSIPTCESLICDSNCHGNTPLHIAAMTGDQAVVEKLYEFFTTQCLVAAPSSDQQVVPWRVKNKEGNTPAHVALLYGNVSVAVYLVEKDNNGYLAREINNSNETLLHLAIQYHVSGNGESKISEKSRSKESYQPTEDIWPIIELLLKIDSSVTCWANDEGSTPLHQATSLEPDYCLRVIKAMLASRSEAADVHEEGSGHTMLHLLTNHQVRNHEEAQELLSIPHVNALKDTKNHQGDTPLHLAARNRDIIMVRVFLESSPKLGLKNKSGVSAASLVQEIEELKETKNIETKTKRKQRFTKEDIEAVKSGNIQFLKEQVYNRPKRDFLALQTSARENILHLLMQSEFFQFEIAEKFIAEAIQIQPSLIIQQDYEGNTYLHTFAEKYVIESGSLEKLGKSIKQVQEEVKKDVRGELHSPPWRVKNVNGDTPLHVAVTCRNYIVATKLLEVDDEVADYVNNRKQTPFHLLHCGLGNRYDPYGVEPNSYDQLISCLIEAKCELPCMQDENGYTALLLAVREGEAYAIKKLFTLFPNSSKIVDNKGRALWHLIVCRLHDYINSVRFNEMRKVSEFLIQNDEFITIAGLMQRKDNDGNTTLHLAIANGQFYFAQFFLHHCYSSFDYDFMLKQENNDGRTPYDFIASAQHLPYQFEKFLFKNGNLLRGHRSMYGVPTTKIEEYANTIGVIAALLTTITFTAAFTVPGGLNSNNGTPLLLQQPTFQVFMVADVVAMCSSIMVLLCLLWIMTTNKKKESLLLLDISVFLLQTSFYATLVTFMTGLYVTTISIIPAIAISTCVACTLLIILMHKRLVMLTVVPFFEILILSSRRLIGSINDYLSNLWFSIKKNKVDEITPEVVEVDEVTSEAFEIEEVTSEVVEVDKITSEIVEVDEMTSEVVKVDKI